MENKFIELIKIIDFNFSINSINFEEYSNKKDELIKILKNAHKKYEDIINKLKSFMGLNKSDFGNFEIDEFEKITNILPSLNKSDYQNFQSYIDFLVNKIEFCNSQKDKVIEQMKNILKMKEKKIDELKSLIGLNNLNLGNMSNFGLNNILNNSVNNISQAQYKIYDETNKFKFNFKQMNKWEKLKNVKKCIKYD